MTGVRAVCLAGCLVCLGAGAPPATQPTPEAPATGRAGAASRPTRFRDRPPEEQRTRLAALLTLMLDLLGVVLVLALFCLFVIRYGRRVSRARRSREHTELEDLWSLKQDDADDGAGDEKR